MELKDLNYIEYSDKQINITYTKNIHSLMNMLQILKKF